jgi:hypothetical protein
VNARRSASGPQDQTARSLRTLVEVPTVAAAIEDVDRACARLREHPVLREQAEQARAEAGLRAARAVAALAGAKLPVSTFRDAVRGAIDLPADPTGRVALGALRVIAETGRLGPGWQTASRQTLARLHLAAATGLVGEDHLGRPRPTGVPPQDGHDLRQRTGASLPAPTGDQLTARLDELGALLAVPEDVHPLLVAGLAVAEAAVARPFLAANQMVALGLGRAIIVTRGLDPTGVAVWETALVESGSAFPAALADYGASGADGVIRWLRTFAEAVTEGTTQGWAVCDSIAQGRPDPG